jgi:hypothetical protein
MSYSIRRRKNQSGGTIKEKKGVAAYLTNLWSNVKAQQKRKLKKRVRKTSQRVKLLGTNLEDDWLGTKKPKPQQGGNIRIKKRQLMNNIPVIYQYHQ